jgi:hypothetical protein
VALGAENVQAAGSNNLLALGLNLALHFIADTFEVSGRQRLRGLPKLFEPVFEKHVGVAAEQNIGSAACHVGGDGDGAFTACLRDDVGLTLVILRVQNLVLNAHLFQEARQAL